MTILRIMHARTPAERIAAFLRDVLIKICRPFPHTPDVRDIQQLIEPIIERERLLAKIEENTRHNDIERDKELLHQVARVEIDIMARLKEHLELR